MVRTTPRQRLGWRGEVAAREFLERRGMRFLDARFRTRHGELDLVMLDGRMVVAVEVKTRRSRRFGAPEEALTERQVNRIEAALQVWLARHPEYQRWPVRLDAILIERAPGRTQLRHLAGLGQG